jgi:hypothetical protein
MPILVPALRILPRRLSVSFTTAMLIIQRPNSSPRSRLSGKWSAALVIACLATAAVLIPVSAHLQPWVEFELVLGAWWVVWAIALSWVLFQAHYVEHDFSVPHLTRANADSEPLALLGCAPDVLLYGWGCGEGCGWVLLAVAGLVALVFFFGCVLPGVAFLLYLAVRGMLARVTNHHRNCEDKPGLALLWGSISATLYTAPVALVVWAVHAFSRKPM